MNIENTSSNHSRIVVMIEEELAALADQIKYADFVPETRPVPDELSEWYRPLGHIANIGDFPERQVS